MKRKKILVVDNQLIILRFMSQLLEKAGHEVLTAENGLAALEILLQETPDVLFIDLIMPNINGEKLSRIIQSIPRFRNSYVIMLAGIAAEHELNLAQLGADACIAKGPFNVMGGHVLEVLQRIDSGDVRESSKTAYGLDSVYPREITRELLSIKAILKLSWKPWRKESWKLPKTPKSCMQILKQFNSPDYGRKSAGVQFKELFHNSDAEGVEKLFEHEEETVQRVSEESPLLLNNRQVTLTLCAFIQ
jgi:CheY-like chemotaxis protein